MPISPMQLALQQAKKAALQNEVPVGAVIVDAAGEVLAVAHNLTQTRQDPTAHAEMLALQQACAIRGNKYLKDCDIYVTLEPCPMCAAALSLTQIRRIYFGAYDPKSGGVEHGARIFQQTSCHHQPEIIGGLQESECGDILRDFFMDKRYRNF